VITPSEVRTHLDTFVVGQPGGKELLSVLLSMHSSWEPAAEEPSPNAFILGPTGSGKTYSLRRGAELLGLPFIAADSTSLVPAGIYGTQIEDLLDRLAHAALGLLRERSSNGQLTDDLDEDDPDDEIKSAIMLAQRGIVFLDEFDKLARASDSSLSDRTQRRLLKAVEGETLPLGTSSTTTRSPFASETMNTRHILWIAGGAFSDIAEPVVRGKRPASVDRKLKNPDQVLSIDIINYGILTELVGRFPVIIQYGKLDRKNLVGILETQQSSPLTLWSYYFDRLGIELIVPDETKETAAVRALELNMGARGLHQVLFGPLSRLAMNLVPDAPKKLVLDPTLLD
jgi:ATP-dependent Clp protease ATP-binding subunit ClpX